MYVFKVLCPIGMLDDMVYGRLMGTHRTNIILKNEQVEFLGDLSYKYKKITGSRISTSEMMRAIIRYVSCLEESYQLAIVQTHLDGADENESKS